MKHEELARAIDRINDRLNLIERQAADQNLKLATTSKDSFATLSAHNELVREFRALQGAVDELVVEDEHTGDLFEPSQGDIFIGCVFSPTGPAVGFTESDHESG